MVQIIKRRECNDTSGFKVWVVAGTARSNPLRISKDDNTYPRQQAQSTNI